MTRRDEIGGPPSFRRKVCAMRKKPGMAGQRIIKATMSAAWVIAVASCVGCEASGRREQVGQGSLLRFPEARSQAEHDRMEREFLERFRSAVEDAQRNN